jgi:DNA-binding CsgD family transcriptional regulator/DNA replicative helicase MCM subunit Mcm2 (Cdc46/Mcm family)
VIVGRAPELAQLDALLEDARRGESASILVVGEPGIGKSALLSTIARRAQGRGFTAIRASCSPGEESVPFALLNDLKRSAGVPMGDVLVGDVVATPAARGDEFLRVLGALTQTAPVLVIVDDGHDADPQSRAALNQAIQRAAGLPVCAIVSSRFQGDPEFATWPRMELGALDIEAGVGVLRVALGTRLPMDELARLSAHMDGNPLALMDAPAWLNAAQREGRSPIPAHPPCPPALVRSWQSTLACLPDGAPKALVALALSGRRSDMLARLLKAFAVTVDDLDPGVERGIVVHHDGRPMLTHRLLGEVILANEPPAAARAAQRAAAEAAQTLDLLPTVVVGHLVAASGGADDEIAARIEEQAERAMQLDLLFMANEAWQAAALLSTVPSERVRRAQRGISLVIHNGLDYAGCDALLALLEGEELDDESAVWVQWLQALQRYQSDPDSALTAQLAAIERARVASPGSVRTLLWDAAMNAWTQGKVEVGLRVAREYVDLEKSTAAAVTGVEPPWTGTALLAAGLFQAGQVTEAMEQRSRAIAWAADVDPVGLAFDQLLTTVFLDDVLLDTSPAAVDRLLVATQRMADRSAPLSGLFGVQAWRARARGDWETARDLLATGRPLAWATGATGPQLGMAALTVELAGLCGDDVQLKDVGDVLRTLGGRVGDARRLATLDRAIGLRALVDGRLDVACASLIAAADVAFLGRGLRDAVLPARVDLVETLVRTGDLDGARRRADDVGPLLMAMGLPDALALASRVEALVSDGDQAAEKYQTAVEFHAKGEDPFEAARTLLLFGEHLRRHRNRTLARSHLTSAERTFEILGAQPWLARARTELRAAGGLAESAIELDCLTAQESAVAQAVAEGRSNREVADALFLSPRTVEYHLSSVYRKLGVHGRGALARKLTDAG